MKKLLFITTLVPFISSAQRSISGNARMLGNKISDIFNASISILIGIAVVIFIWGLFVYVTESKNEGKRQDAKNYMIYGVVAIFIMISVWGIVAILSNTFGLTPFIGLPNPK